MAPSRAQRSAQRERHRRSDCGVNRRHACARAREWRRGLILLYCRGEGGRALLACIVFCWHVNEGPPSGAWRREGSLGSGSSGSVVAETQRWRWLRAARVGHACVFARARSSLLLITHHTSIVAYLINVAR